MATAFAAALLGSTVVWAHPVRFLGPHPIAAKHGGGYCYIDAPHLHGYRPDRPALFQEVGGELVFTGDPTPFGFEGDRHSFYGHHPIVLPEGADGQPVFCLIDGPHFHAFVAPDSPAFTRKGDVAFYVGPPPAVKPAHVRLVNAEYRPYVALRPTVTVEPPPEWHGEVWVAPPAIEVGVPAPGVVIAPPAPHVAVSVGVPGVYVAPPAPHVAVSVGVPGVYVAPPAPHMVVRPVGAVVVGAPGAVVVRGRGENDQGENEGRGHHDNGLHRGWGKHGR
jgi:hypothetical protein